MRRAAALLISLLVLSACSDRSTVSEEAESQGQAGASSGPNPNFDGEAAGDAFGEPMPAENGAVTPDDSDANDASNGRQN